MKTKILACAASLPTNSVTSRDMFVGFESERQYDIPSNWMHEKMGIRSRLVSTPGTQPSSLAVEASKKVLAERPEINPDDIGMVLFCGIERDFVEPATAHRVQSKLGLSAQYVFDVSNACFGFVDGINIANSFIESGTIKYALVTTGEVQEHPTNNFLEQLKRGVSTKKAWEIIGFLSLGDAGGAALIGPSESNSGFEMYGSSIKSKHVEKCFYNHAADGNGYDGNMAMAQISAKGFIMQKQLLSETLKKLGWSTFDWLLSHQTGRRNYEKTCALNLTKPGHLIQTYETMGNITSATLPVNFEKMLNNGKAKKGHKVGGFFAGSGITVGQFGYTL